jgi:hypothetical protein
VVHTSHISILEKKLGSELGPNSRLVLFLVVMSTFCGKSFSAGKELYRETSRASGCRTPSSQSVWMAGAKGLILVRVELERQCDNFLVLLLQESTGATSTPYSHISKTLNPCHKNRFAASCSFLQSAQHHLLFDRPTMTFSRGMSSLSSNATSVWEDEMGAMADQLFFVTSYRCVSC